MDRLDIISVTGSLADASAELVKTNTIKTSDGFEFTIDTKDVIELTEDQFNSLAATVLRRKAKYIRKDGVDIASLTSEQVQAVIQEISKRVGDSENPIKDNLVKISDHIISDHATKPVTLKKRGWFRDTINEVYDDIASVIKEVKHVRKAIVKFHPTKEKAIPKFTFTVLGLKVNGDEGEVAIAFIEDDGDLILAVTII